MYHFISTIALFLATANVLVCAQSPPPVGLSSDAQCESQEIVDTCVSMMQKYLQKCSSDNWDCKCSGFANMANCYVDCPDSPDYIAAQSSSASSCATANAYDVGNTVVPDTWKTMDFHNTIHATATKAVENLRATPTSTNTIDNQEKAAQTSEGAAASMNRKGSWLALVGLGVGAMF